MCKKLRPTSDVLSVILLAQTSLIFVCLHQTLELLEKKRAYLERRMDKELEQAREQLKTNKKGKCHICFLVTNLDMLCPHSTFALVRSVCEPKLDNFSACLLTKSASLNCLIKTAKFSLMRSSSAKLLLFIMFVIRVQIVHVKNKQIMKVASGGGSGEEGGSKGKREGRGLGGREREGGRACVGKHEIAMASADGMRVKWT